MHMAHPNVIIRTLRSKQGVLLSMAQVSFEHVATTRTWRSTHLIPVSRTHRPNIVPMVTVGYGENENRRRRGEGGGLNHNRIDFITDEFKGDIDG